MIRLLGKCSNKSTYEYSDDEIKHIFNVIEVELKTSKNRFKNVDSKDNKFTLR